MLSRCKYIYSSGLLAKVGSGRRAADVPGHRDLSPAPPAQPEALVHCSCLVGEKSWKPQIRITTAGELLISLPVEQQLQELKPNGSNKWQPWNPDLVELPPGSQGKPSGRRRLDAAIRPLGFVPSPVDSLRVRRASESMRQAAP